MVGAKVGCRTLTWNKLLKDEFERSYFKDLVAFIESERKADKVIYPNDKDLFKALELTPFLETKVVILGQDPYHGPGQAHGLSFSVPSDLHLPPSLRNIFKELSRDLNLWSDLPNKMPKSGDLSGWAKQGVLMLNAVLTVEAGMPGSHAKRGWERFTDTIIKLLNDNLTGVVFLLWGAYAQRKGDLIDARRHLVLSAPHPSPLSALRGFIGCGHFSAVNRYLKAQDRQPIEWGCLAH